jgi:hypothetical protein
VQRPRDTPAPSTFTRVRCLNRGNRCLKCGHLFARVVARPLRPQVRRCLRLPLAAVSVSDAAQPVSCGWGGGWVGRCEACAQEHCPSANARCARPQLVECDSGVGARRETRACKPSSTFEDGLAAESHQPSAGLVQILHDQRAQLAPPRELERGPVYVDVPSRFDQSHQCSATMW